MSHARLVLDVAVSSVAHGSMPPNCEVLARVYVGDLQYGLARDPQNRGLYLLSLDGYFFMDVQQLIAAFAGAQREWDRERMWLGGGGLTLDTNSPRQATAPGIDRSERQPATVKARGRGRSKKAA